MQQHIDQAIPHNPVLEQIIGLSLSLCAVALVHERIFPRVCLPWAQTVLLVPRMRNFWCILHICWTISFCTVTQTCGFLWVQGSPHPQWFSWLLWVITISFSWFEENRGSHYLNFLLCCKHFNKQLALTFFPRLDGPHFSVQKGIWHHRI